MSEQCPAERVLSIFPLRLGFSYAVLEGGMRLVDWGVARLGRQTDTEFRRRVAATIEGSRPTTVVCEDDSNPRRGETARRRAGIAIQAADFVGVPVKLASTDEIRSALGLGNKASKQEVADQLVRRFPELSWRAPSNRIWQRDPKMNLFEAVAMAAAGVTASDAGPVTP